MKYLLKQRFMKKSVIMLLLAFVGAGLSSSAWAEKDKAFFWQVDSKSGDATIYLMGSIHFADKSFYPLRDEISQAFKRSDYLVVELDIDEEAGAKYNKIISQRGLIEDGDTIKDVVTDETWLKLRQRLHRLNIPYDAVKNYKPGVLVLTLTSVQVMKLGLDPKLGIDAYFLAGAKNPVNGASVKKIIELETLEQQINLFLDIPNGDLLLKESLYSLDESEKLMADMVLFWKQGDEKQMSKLLFEDALTDYPAFGEIYDKLFYERNDQMTNKINKMLKNKGNYFVVVGGGHLVGEKGIVNQLREKGYAVRRR